MALSRSLSVEDVKALNARSVVSGDVTVHRETILPGILKVPSKIYRPFKSPVPAGWAGSGLSSNGGKRRRTLGMRYSRAAATFPPSSLPRGIQAQEEDDNSDDEERNSSSPVDLRERNITVWEPSREQRQAGMKPVTIHHCLGTFLREHQIEGVKFLFECCTGLRDFEGSGCILADDMGLGKTLQSISLLFTLLRQGIQGKPVCKKAIVCCPTSLVRNWENEIKKWLQDRISVVAVSESSKRDVEKCIGRFLPRHGPQVLIISYDTFRLHEKLFLPCHSRCCDLLICDEAHRLKNDATLTSQCLNRLPCRRRVLLSGTPLQNDLCEFFSMVNFCNPGVLGTINEFRRNYQNPILIGREPDATDKECEKSEACAAKLSNIVNKFILRRTNTLLSKHLPPKLTQVVVVNLSPMQREMYARVVTDAQRKKKMGDVLACITSLKKLCNHPQLLYRAKNAKSNKSMDFSEFFPQDFGSSLRRKGGDARSANSSNVDWSGKMQLLANMLHELRATTDDRIVIVSNFTQTLDIVSRLCAEKRYPCVRLDGSTSAKKRQKLVDRLNDPSDDVLVFLLSSKAGGCGLNLIGANRLILLDPDWNPANDRQAAARVWRDGQKKRTYVYRFLARGTIEEKVYQRQLSKEGLQGIVDAQNLESQFSMRDLKDLFSLKEDTLSDTHSKFKCRRCDPRLLRDMVKKFSKPKGQKKNSGEKVIKRAKRAFVVPRKATTSGNAPEPNGAPQQGSPNEGDLNKWSHHIAGLTVDDTVLKKAGAGGLVSFVFGCAVGNFDALQEMKSTEAKLVQMANSCKENESYVNKTSEIGPEEGFASCDHTVEKTNEGREVGGRIEAAKTKKRISSVDGKHKTEAVVELELDVSIDGDEHTDETKLDLSIDGHEEPKPDDESKLNMSTDLSNDKLERCAPADSPKVSSIETTVIFEDDVIAKFGMSIDEGSLQVLANKGEIAKGTETLLPKSEEVKGQRGTSEVAAPDPGNKPSNDNIDSSSATTSTQDSVGSKNSSQTRNSAGNRSSTHNRGKSRFSLIKHGRFSLQKKKLE